jgi:nucleotide-binding universal stress UspA family protein
MKTILVPTDFGTISEQALDVAIQIARLNHSQIKLLTMTHFPAMGFSVADTSILSKSDYSNAVLNNAKQKLQGMIEKYSDVKISPIVKEEDESLTAAILSEDADLIVMGSEGATGWKEAFSGSHAQYVVRYAECPVLIIKEPTKEFSLDKVLYVTDFTNTTFIDKALKTLKTTKTKNYFLYVDTGMKFFNGHVLSEKLDEIAKTFKIKDFEFEIHNSPTVEKGVLEYAQEIEADIIIMYTHGREGLERIFKGSIAEDVVNHSPIPVMTILA